MRVRTATKAAVGLFVQFLLISLPQPAFAQQAGVYEALPLATELEKRFVEDANELEELFQRRGLQFRDPEAESWINDIAAKLLPEVTDPEYIDYRFYLLRDPDANAFALPDGQIYVHTGLLARIGDEAELAALLAHEISHVAGHHGLLYSKTAHRMEIATTVFDGILTGVDTGIADLLNQAQSQAFLLSIRGYSRALEREADYKGFDWMLAAGYDPKGMIDLFTELYSDTEGTKPRVKTKWNTHPDVEERKLYTKDRIAGLSRREKRNLSRGEDDVFRITKRIALMTVNDYIEIDFPRTALKLIDDLEKRFPGEPGILVAKGDAWHLLGPRDYLDPDLPIAQKMKWLMVWDRGGKTRKERWAKDLKKKRGRENYARHLGNAELAYKQALEIDSGSALAMRGLAEIYDTRDRPLEAVRAYIEYVELAPTAPDRRNVQARALQLLEGLLPEMSDGDQEIGQ